MSRPFAFQLNDNYTIYGQSVNFKNIYSKTVTKFEEIPTKDQCSLRVKSVQNVAPYFLEDVKLAGI